MFDTLFSFVEQATTSNIASMVGTFASTIAPLIGGCVVLYAIYLAYKALYDQQNMMIMESVQFIIALAFCTTIAFNTEWYLSSIVPAVLYTGDDISGALLGGSGDVGSIQSMYNNIGKNVQELWDDVDISMTSGESIKEAAFLFLFMFLILAGGLPFLAVATAYLLVAKIMVSFLLILGPVFIMFAFFPSTRSMFQSWTGQCFNYLLLSILYPIAFALFERTIDMVIGGQNMNISTAFMTFILFFVFIVLSTQIPTFCSSLSGGIGINGLVSNIGTLGNPMAKGLINNSLTRGAASKAAGGVKAAYEAAKGSSTIKPG